MTRRAVRFSVLLVALAGPASAQLISIKTVPIAQGDQFDIFPSNNFGMGGVSIALADTLLDPFINPAKGARLGSARFFSAPTVYSISQRAGGGRTLPLAAVAGSGAWFGGLSLALQEVDASRPPPNGDVVLAAPTPLAAFDTAAVPLPLPTIPPRNDASANQYALGLVGNSGPPAPPPVASGWRIGWLATANRMSHPKRPEYELANVPVIPRDPGHSAAYNVGLGLSKASGPATFAIDAIYEPIWSYTWADAASPVVTTTGDTIPVGGKTVENRFRFSNGLFRMGVSREVALPSLGKALGLQLGIVVQSVHYRLVQYDNVQVAERNLTEGWREWSPTWGLSLRFPDLEIRYRGRATHGTGRPGVQPSGVFFASRDLAVAGNSILVAPSGPLSLTEVRTTTHQISVSLPLR